MTTTAADLRVLKEAAEVLANQICGCATPGQRKADIAALIAYEAAAEARGREAGLREAAGIAAHYNFGPAKSERDSARNAIAQIIESNILSRIKEPNDG
jgi:hypothetical protein